MKFRYQILCALLFLCLKVNAQYVVIPDPIFAAWIHARAPMCMSGNQLNTTCIQLNNFKYMNLDDLGIWDLTGVHYFDSLALVLVPGIN